jgi:hypothetical protein
MQKVNSLSWLALSESQTPVSCDLLHVFPHALQFRNVPLEQCNFAFQKRHHLCAWNSSPIPRPKDIGKFRKRKPKAKRVPDHVDALEAPCWVDPVAGRGSWGFSQNSHSLVMP